MQEFVEELIDSMPMRYISILLFEHGIVYCAPLKLFLSCDSEEDPGRPASCSPDMANSEQHSYAVSTIQQVESEGPLTRGAGEYDYMTEFTDSDFHTSG